MEMAQVEIRRTTSGSQGKVADIQVCGGSVLQCRKPIGSLKKLKGQRQRKRR